MNKVFSLAYHNVIRDLRQPLALLITVVFSVVLLITTFVSVSSFIEYREQLNISSSANYDLAILDVKYDLFNAIDFTSNENIKKVDFTRNIGFAQIGENYINKKEYMYIQELSFDGMKNEGFVLKSGRLPQNEKEIIISNEYSNIYKKSVGDVVLYNIGFPSVNGGYQYLTTNRLNSNVTITPQMNYKFEIIDEKIYTIVGIYESSNSIYIDNTDLNHYYAYSYLNNSSIQMSDLVDVLITGQTNTKPSEYLGEYAQKLNATMDRYTNQFAAVYANKNDLGFSVGLKVVTYIITTVMVLILIFFALKSSLEYNNEERKNAYTQWMSLGATTEEIKKSWDFQTFIIAFIAIPLGICVTLLFNYILIALYLPNTNVNIIVKGAFSATIIIVSALAILLCLIAANRSSESKILYSIPLDYLKSHYENINVKFVHYGNITKLKGELDKYVTSNFRLKHITSQTFIFCLSVSIGFIMMFTSLNNVATTPIIEYLKTKPSSLTLRIEGTNDYKKELKEIASLQSVDDYTISKNIDSSLYIKSNSLMINLIPNVFKTLEDGYFKLPVNLLVVDDAQYVKIFSSRIGNEGTEANEYPIIVSSGYNSKSRGMISIYDNNTKGENLNLFYADNETNEKDGISLEKYIVFSTDDLKSELKYNYLNIIVADSYFQEKMASDLDVSSVKYNTINIVTNDENQFFKDLNSYMSNNKFVVNVIKRETDVLSKSNYIYISYVTAYIVLAFATLLLFMICIETINTHTKSREKELGLLKSMGASSKQLEDVIQKEFGKGYFISTLMGIVLGVLANTGIIMFFSVDTIESTSSSINQLISMGIIIVVVFIFFFVSLAINTRDLKKKYPIELMEGNLREF